MQKDYKESEIYHPYHTIEREDPLETRDRENPYHRELPDDWDLFDLIDIKNELMPLPA